MMNNTKHALAVSLILVLALFSSLCTEPVINFGTTTHDFGDIREEDGEVTFDFGFTNTGDEELQLVKVKAS